MSLTEDFLAHGIVKIPIEDPQRLDMIKQVMISCVRDHIKDPYINTHEINDFHLKIGSHNLNDIRIGTIRSFNNHSNARQTYFYLAQDALEELIGNEIVIQRNVNLSIQLPNDDSSLLPVHCDTWSGDSPYEVVLWVPLVDCYGTKSMYFCNKAKSEEIHKNISRYNNSEDIYKAIENDIEFMDVKYGECLIFTQNILHGNVVNTTNETRWSMNCRFKSLFSPYGDKKLGEFFEPIAICPATKFGMEYEYPRI